MQPNEVKCMKLFVNSLIIFSSDMVNLKLVKNKKELLEYLEKEKMTIVQSLNQLINTIEQRYDIAK